MGDGSTAACGSVAERELGVFAHALGRPRRREHELREDLAHTVEFDHELLDLVGDLRADRAAGGRKRIRDVYVVAALPLRGRLELDLVDQAELDEVQAQLGVDHVLERLKYVFLRENRHVLSLEADRYSVAVPLVLLLIIFVAVPIVELWVIIRTADALGGGATGAGLTFALLAADSLLGAWLARSQGRAAWNGFVGALQRGEVPAKEIVDGAFVIVGGALLLTPGFITDVVGVLMLIPPTRRLLSRPLIRIFMRRVSFATTGVDTGLRDFRRSRQAHYQAGHKPGFSPPDAGQPADTDRTDDKYLD